MSARDIYGTALLDYLAKPSNQIIEVLSDIAEDDEYPVSWFFREEKDFPELEVKALELCKGKVLDVGAGTGIHSLALQRRKYDVRAIDISKGAIQAMQKQGVIDANLQDFYQVQNEKFDTLLMLMNGFGIMGKLDGIPAFFEKADELLSQGGQIIADSSDLIELYREEDGAILLDLNGPYYGEIVYTMKFKNQMGAPFPWLFVDFDTLAHYANKSGFIAVKIFEDSTKHYLAKITRK